MHESRETNSVISSARGCKIYIKGSHKALTSHHSKANPLSPRNWIRNGYQRNSKTVKALASKQDFRRLFSLRHYHKSLLENKIEEYLCTKAMARWKIASYFQALLV